MDTSILQVFSRKGGEAIVASSLGDTPGLSCRTTDYTSMPLSPRQWLVTSVNGADCHLKDVLQRDLGNSVYLSEQSHSRIIIRVAGEGARELLQKGCRLDLHESRASSGFCAQTAMAQIGVLIHQVDELPTYDLHIYSGFAQSFWHWLTEMAAPHGYKVIS
ncbi:MAG: sarcosine oxidase subunit gamma [Granulosicoccus sp.]